MNMRVVVAAAVAALLMVQAPISALANPDKQKEQARDGQSRYEVAPYSYLPLILSDEVRLRIALMVVMMQSWTYQLSMASGVDVTSQNRVSLGGLFGGVFAESYSAKDFVKSLEVGSVYRAGDDTIAVALKDDLRLEDYRIIVFNGDNQYDVRERPALQQIERERLAQFGVLTMVSAMLNHTLNPAGVRLLADLETTADGTELLPPQLHDLPQLRKALVGKVYRGSDNTLLVVIPPAIVLDK